jgi:glycosyltransferase involved in cell wall biosynthesis
VELSGKPSILATFFETTQLAPEAVARAGRYPLVVAGSTWNAEILRAYGLKNVRTVLQGIDPQLFHPGARQGLYADRFVVFSGGKLERRKGQDIVVAAFRKFVERHPDALLVTIWANGWAKHTSTINEGNVAAPVPFDSDGKIDIRGWAAVNGIPERNFADLGFIPNSLLPGILREMDVAVFPNRAEGGTNLVAMECMASGIPTILSRNTGHLDLFEDDNCYALDQQGELSGREGGMNGVPGWGESDVDELVEKLEQVYAHREEALRRGARGAATVGRLTWAKSAAQLKPLVLEA